MKKDKIKITVEVEDRESFKQLMAETQVEMAMRLCPEKLRLQVLDHALSILKGEKAITKWWVGWKAFMIIFNIKIYMWGDYNVWDKVS